MLKASGPGRINEIVVKKELDAAQGMVPSSAVVTTSGGSYATGYGAAEYLRDHHSPFLQHPQHLTLKEGSSRISSNQQDFLPPYGPFVEQNPSRGRPGLGTFVSLATQDFLQPLERGGREENGIAAGLEIARHVGNGIVNGSVDNSSPKSLLQLSVRNGSLRDKLYNEREDHQRKDAGSDQLKEKGQSCTSWSTLRMQSGYSELPHANRGTISGLEASQPSVMGINRHWQQNPATTAGKRSRSVPSEDDEIDDDCDRRKVHKGEGIQRDDAISKSVENKGNTPRSKHSATEQRRRSKINDRFQMLRDLVPHGDQKRDKASFLLEVVEYIQALQEKVKKCEAVEQGRHQEKLKSIAWDLSKRNIAHTSPDDIAVLDRDINSFPSTSPHKANNSGIVEAELTSVGAHVSTSNNHNPGRSGLSSQQPRISLSPSMPETRAAEDLPKAEALISERVLQSAQTDIIKQADAGKTVSSTGILEQTAACDGKNISSSEKESRRCEQEDVPITGGVISVSTAYSQGLLDALTRALHSSGLDLSQANISVQIELGKASTNGTSSKVPS